MVTLTDLPVEVLEMVFKMVSYRDLAYLRLVCRQFEQVSVNINKMAVKRLIRLTSELKIGDDVAEANLLRDDTSDTIILENMICMYLNLCVSRLQLMLNKLIGLGDFFPWRILEEAYRIVALLSEAPVSLDLFRNVRYKLHEIIHLAVNYTNFKCLALVAAGEPGGAAGGESAQQRTSRIQSKIMNWRKFWKRLKNPCKKSGPASASSNASPGGAD